jgi:hypothetical protein
MNKYERNIFDMFKYYQREYDTEDGIVRENLDSNDFQMLPAEQTKSNTRSNSTNTNPAFLQQPFLNPQRCISQTFQKKCEDTSEYSFEYTVNQINKFLQRNCTSTCYDYYYNNFWSFVNYLEDQNEMFNQMCNISNNCVLSRNKL